MQNGVAESKSDLFNGFDLKSNIDMGASLQPAELLEREREVSAIEVQVLIKAQVLTSFGKLTGACL